MRAASTACTVSGIGNVASGSPSTQVPSDSTSAPLSTSSPTSSSRKKGLPSARSTTDRRTCSGRSADSISSSMSEATSTGRGPSQSTVEFRLAAPHAGRSTSRSGRAVASTTSGARTSATMRSRRSSRSGSAQWMSSTRSTVGRLQCELLHEPHRGQMKLLSCIERVDARGDVETERQPEELAAREALFEVLGGCSLAKSQVLTDDLAERPVRDPVAVREAATGADGRGGFLAGESDEELAHQTRFPDARLADERDEVRLRGGRRTPVRRTQQLELAVPPDEHPPEARHSPRTHGSERPHDRHAVDASGLALRADGTGGAPNSNAPAAAAAVRSPASTSPGSAAFCRRSATFTASPVTNDDPPSCGGPTTTSPVLTPTRRRSWPSKRSRIRRCMASPVWSARSAWSSSAAGAPNTAMTASPANFSTVPPVSSISSRMAW